MSKRFYNTQAAGLSFPPKIAFALVQEFAKGTFFGGPT